MTKPNPRNTKHRKTDRDKYIEPDEYQAILVEAKKRGQRDHLLMALGGNLGLRVSELVSLRVTDFDMRRGVVLIRHRKSKSPYGGAKVGRMRLNLGIRGLVSKWIDGRTTGWLFQGRCEGHVGSALAQRTFKACAKAAGLSKMYSIHALRHYLVMAMVAAEIPLPEISKRLGHTSSDTMFHYFHLTSFSRKRIMEILREASLI